MSSREPRIKLFITEGSPYARKARIVARERAVAAVVDEIRVTLRSFENEVLRHSPLGRVPTLVLDDGSVFTESSLICAYLDGLRPEGRLIPRGARERERALADDALATGMLDGAITMLRELRRPAGEQSARVLSLERERAARCLAAFERGIVRLEPPLSLAQITIACTFGLIDAFIGQLDFRAQHPRLTEWYAELSQRPSLLKTAPPNATC